MNKGKVHLHLGTLEDMGARFVSAWKAAENSEFRGGEHVTFLSTEAFVAALSPKRLALLRHVHKEGPCSVRALSMALERDYKSVHQDVAKLLASGLLARRADKRIEAPWDRMVAEVDLAA